MNIFAVSDLHLAYGAGCEKSMDAFGGIWVNHEEILKAAWLRQVSDDDIILMPGDFSWAMKLEDTAKDFEWLNSLPGKKIFVRGNHDIWWNSLKKLNAAYPEIVFIQNSSYIAGDVAVIGSRGWTGPSDKDFSEETDRKIYERERMRLKMSFDSLSGKSYKRLICMMHYPPRDFADLFSQFNVNYVIYGHLHGEQAFRTAYEGEHEGTYYKLVSVDRLSNSLQLIYKV